MSRYIDADAYRERMSWVYGEYWEEVLNEAQGIDIVRCKECKKAFNAESEWICNHLSGMVGLNVVVKPDDFCSYGEREGE